MKVTGSATLAASREKVWHALNDPAVLVRTIPGCQQLEETGPDQYSMTLFAGVASIKGTYTGSVRLTDQDQPSSFVLRAAGAGGPGTVEADVTVRLAENGSGSTRLDYDADAVVGGMIGGVGQRVLTGVAKKTAGEFFTAVDDVLTGNAPAEHAAASAAGTAAAAEAGSGAPAGQVYRAPGAGLAEGVTGGDFVKGVLVGAAVALLGALVGGLVARRR